MQTRLIPEPHKFVTHVVGSTLRNVLLGAGLCYSYQNEFYYHMPVIVIFPSIYAGYNAYQNKDAIVRYIAKIKHE